MPVPDHWRTAVELAIEDLMTRSAVPRRAVAPALVAEASWLEPDSGARRDGIEIWLVSRGLTHRYRAILSDETAPEVAPCPATP